LCRYHCRKMWVDDEAPRVPPDPMNDPAPEGRQNVAPPGLMIATGANGPPQVRNP
jgi:hypothetical protein